MNNPFGGDVNSGRCSRVSMTNTKSVGMTYGLNNPISVTFVGLILGLGLYDLLRPVSVECLLGIRKPLLSPGAVDGV